MILAAVWLGLLVLLVLATARFHSRRLFFAGTLGFLLLSVITVVVSQASAYAPPIVDAEGKPMPDSIATLEKVNLNGSEQWISIRGTSIDKPVLLFLAGGPGGSQLAATRHALGGLEDHFVVVNWEQPGAGKSFDAVQRSTLTPERYIEDGHALVLYLKQRFDEQKVYLVGESWGSALGILLVQRYPELFHAFVGTGQMVAFQATDVMDYSSRCAGHRSVATSPRWRS
jgi:pimeloyl-ACP methyl ester carboxylesterase